jgi:hypothetical protein
VEERPDFPYQSGTNGPFAPDFRAAIETDDGATIIWESPMNPGR